MLGLAWLEDHSDGPKIIRRQEVIPTNHDDLLELFGYFLQGLSSSHLLHGKIRSNNIDVQGYNLLATLVRSEMKLSAAKCNEKANRVETFFSDRRNLVAGSN